MELTGEEDTETVYCIMELTGRGEERRRGKNFMRCGRAEEGEKGKEREGREARDQQ